MGAGAKGDPGKDASEDPVLMARITALEKKAKSNADASTLEAINNDIKKLKEGKTSLTTTVTNLETKVNGIQTVDTTGLQSEIETLKTGNVNTLNLKTELDKLTTLVKKADLDAYAKLDDLKKNYVKQADIDDKLSKLDEYGNLDARLDVINRQFDAFKPETIEKLQKEKMDVNGTTMKKLQQDIKDAKENSKLIDLNKDAATLKSLTAWCSSDQNYCVFPKDKGIKISTAVNKDGDGDTEHDGKIFSSNLWNGNVQALQLVGSRSQLSDPSNKRQIKMQGNTTVSGHLRMTGNGDNGKGATIYTDKICSTDGKRCMHLNEEEGIYFNQGKMVIHKLNRDGPYDTYGWGPVDVQEPRSTIYTGTNKFDAREYSSNRYYNGNKWIGTGPIYKTP